MDKTYEQLAGLYNSGTDLAVSRSTIMRDFNPIELSWSKVKHSIKAEKARDHDALDKSYAKSAAAVTPKDAAGWSSHCRKLGQAM